jgi:serine/threonine-protein kinase ULK4
VRIFRETKSIPLRVRVAQTLGALIRNASYVPVDLQQAGALVALAGGVRDRESKVRRRAMAVLGELLYYISSQGETESEEGAVHEEKKSQKNL